MKPVKDLVAHESNLTEGPGAGTRSWLHVSYSKPRQQLLFCMVLERRADVLDSNSMRVIRREYRLCTGKAGGVRSSMQDLATVEETFSMDCQILRLLIANDKLSRCL